jgi:hypothetical protein
MVIQQDEKPGERNVSNPGMRFKEVVKESRISKSDKRKAFRQLSVFCNTL